MNEFPSSVERRDFSKNVAQFNYERKSKKIYIVSNDESLSLDISSIEFLEESVSSDKNMGEIKTAYGNIVLNFQNYFELKGIVSNSSLLEKECEFSNQDTFQVSSINLSFVKPKNFPHSLTKEKLINLRSEGLSTFDRTTDIWTFAVRSESDSNKVTLYQITKRQYAILTQ